MQTVLVVLVCTGLAMAARLASAAQHVVGGSQGWEESTDFDSWASGLTFKLGDQLVFKYSGLHSVVELGSETAYKSCDLGTPVKSMSSGNDVVKLTKPGARYFACGTPGHCDQGMKVKVNVVSSDTAASTPDSASKSGPSPDSGSKSGSNSDSNSKPGSSSGHGLWTSSMNMIIGLLATGLIWAF
ncbi:PREDICTED: mavicyanin [Tarenaya hassleriana]|uniref:mavicyanin n=1 Tax=Tarenaya hassleriana TaxID=28532 RepID=UPI00053C5FDA|nr:PREDICTED: mavicyanin [Tarenaya hassleriana]